MYQALSRSRGFTLIELLVVIAIIALLIVLLVPLSSLRLPPPDRSGVLATNSEFLAGATALSDAMIAEWVLNTPRGENSVSVIR